MQATQTAYAGLIGDHVALFACRDIGLLTPGRNIGELHIATEGRWEGHAEGPFEFTADVFDQMIARFEAQSNPMGVDYEHRTFNRAAPDSTAAGWIQKLEKRQGPNGWELWAITEWTDRAAGMIRASEYKFCSPAFTFTSKDRKTGDVGGAQLTNVALTNLPFLDGQEPIKLSWLAALPPAQPDAEEKPVAEAPPSEPPKAAETPSEEATEEAAESVPPEVSPEAEQARALNEQLTAAIDQMAETAGIDRAAVVELLAAMADRVGGMMRDRAESDGTPAEERQMSAVTTEDPKGAADAAAASAAADEARIAAIAAKAAEQDKVLMLSRLAELEKANQERDAREKAAKDAADAARIDAMVKCGQLAETERNDATWLLSAHPDRFESMYASRSGLAKPVPIGESQAGTERGSVVDPEKATPADLRPDEVATYQFLCRQGGWNPEKALKRVVARRNKDASAAGGGARVG